MRTDIPTSRANIVQNASQIVREFLAQMQRRDLAGASAYLTADFHMTFPGSRTFKTRDELVRWSATRYQSIAK